MTNNKQQTAVEWLWGIAYNRELTVADWKQAKEMEKEQRSLELPTDEQLEYIYDTIIPFGPDRDWIIGAKWMRDKIQGGNNDKQ